jgi:hypothetical protein
MSRVLEQAAVQLVVEVLDSDLGATPRWLQRPGRSECGHHWALVYDIYTRLTGLELPVEMPTRERRRVDAVIAWPGHASRIFEFDESQHFNAHRAATLRLYPQDLKLAFPRETWLAACEASTRKLSLTGGWGRAKPPLFPDPGGRHLQRAFRDALTDILPPVHGWAPTLRIADFEVESWIHGPDARQRMDELVRRRLAA